MHSVLSICSPSSVYALRPQYMHSVLSICTPSSVYALRPQYTHSVLSICSPSSVYAHSKLYSPGHNGTRKQKEGQNASSHVEVEEVAGAFGQERSEMEFVQRAVVSTDLRPTTSCSERSERQTACCRLRLCGPDRTGLHGATCCCTRWHCPQL